MIRLYMILNPSFYKSLLIFGELIFNVFKGDIFDFDI